MGTFAVPAMLDRNDICPYAEAACGYGLAEKSALTGSVGLGSPAYGGIARLEAALRYGVKF